MIKIQTGRKHEEKYKEEKKWVISVDLLSAKS